MTVDLETVSGAGAKVPRIAVRDSALRAVSSIRPRGHLARSSSLRPGSYVLEIGGSHFAAQTIPVKVESGKGTVVRVRAAKGYTSTVQVILPSGSNRSDKLRLTITGDHGVVLDRLIPSAGRSILPFRCFLAPGSYEVVAVMNKGPSDRGRLVVDGAGAVPASLRLQIK